MNRLTTERRAQIISCLVEGNSIRATSRMTYDVYGHLFEAHDDRRQDCANQIASELLAAE